MPTDAQLRRLGIDRTTFGHVITILGVLVLSPDSLAVRLVEDVPNYTSIFVKFLIYAVTIFMGMVILDYCYDDNIEYYMIDAYDRMVAKFRSIGYLGLGAGVWWGVSNLAFMLALQHTAVANVLVIMATNPIFSAFASMFLLGEKIDLRTGLISVLGFTVIAVIFSQDISENDNDTDSIKGIGFAIFSSLSYGSYFVLIRLAGKVNSGPNARTPDLNACNVISGLVVVVITACLGGTEHIHSLSRNDVMYLCIQGIIILPLSFTLLIIGPQYILAPEVCIYSFLETILGPLWVWLGGFESPPMYTIYGGAVLLVALGGNSILSIKEAVRVNSANIANSNDNRGRESNNEEGSSRGRDMKSPRVHQIMPHHGAF